MNDTLEIREARADEIALVQELVREMAKYEKRPEDMTGTQETLSYWLFERKIATILLLEYEKKVIGITAMTKMLGKTKFEELLSGLIEKPQGKPTLVPMSDNRPAMKNTAFNDFKEDN